MINHARTLLLNLPGAGTGFSGHVGEEFIDPAYKAITMPSHLLAIRRQLFGSNPDRLLLNYRARQYLGMLHATELAEFVTTFDPRITYDVLPDDDLFADAFATTVTPLNATTSPLYMLGELAPIEDGRTEQSWRVLVANGSDIHVTRQTPPVGTSIQPYTVTDDLSSVIVLTGSGLQARVQPTIGSEWLIRAVGRPARELGTILANIAVLGEDVHAELFRIGSPAGATEPFLTFRNLWRYHPELPYRLGGILLALLHQTDELRTGGA